jgi:hypothetical protein
MEGMFEVHCDVVQNTILDHPFDHHIISAIGIQFDQESHLLDPLGEVVEILMQCRFSSANTDAIQQTLPAFQEVEKHFFGDQIVLKKHHFFR